MSLREEMARYEHLTGESAEHIPIIKIGAFLDGVDRGIAELEAIKAEFEDKILLNQTVAIQIMDKHISDLKGDKE